MMALSLSGLIPGCSGGVSYLPVRPIAVVTPSVGSSLAPNVIGSPPATAAPTPTQSPASGGVVVIVLPTAAPLICAPTPVIVPVAQTTIISCASQGYFGPFTWSLSDPTVASVELATGTLNFFYINGLKSGTTTLSLQFSISGSGSVSITVP